MIKPPYRIDKSRRNYTDPNKPRYAANDIATPPNRKPGKIKVVTYNIQFSRKINKAIDFIKSHKTLNDADVLCLQEMETTGVERMAQQLKYNYVYYPAVKHPRHEKDFGNAILSKWPFISDKKIILPHIHHKNLQRIAVRATLAIGEKRVIVYCVHMKVFLNIASRKGQVNELIKLIPKGEKHIIFAGDFNTYSKANYKATYESFSEGNLECASENVDWTFKHWYLLYKKSKLDHVFVKGCKVLQAGSVNNRKPSDHVPLWVELKI